MDSHHGNPHHRGGRTPTTQGSVKSEDTEPPTVDDTITMAYAVGTPAIPGDEDDDESAIQNPASPPPGAFHGHDPASKKQEYPLSHAASGVVPNPPSDGRFGNITPTVASISQPAGAAATESDPPEEARIALPQGTPQGTPQETPQEKEEDVNDAPSSSGNGSSMGFFSRLTRTQWALRVGPAVVIVVLIGVIVVLVASNASSGAGATPSGSPTEAPHGGPLTTASNAPQTAPSESPISSTTLSPMTNPTAVPDETSAAPDPAPSISPTSSPSSNQPTLFVGSPTLESMMTSGVLLCGVTPGISGFSTANGDTYEGFEADLCRALAAAALGSEENVEFVPVEVDDMFTALNLGAVDVLASHVTHTMERDVYEGSAEVGFTFSIPYLYDGLTFGGLTEYADCADRLDTSGNCTSLRVCVLEVSTHAALAADLIPGALLIPLPSMEAFYDTFDSELCDVLAGDRFEVAEATVRNNGYTGEYKVGENLHSHEPLSLVTRDDDARWSDMVFWVVQALLAAEEQGVFMDTTESFVTTELFGDSFATLFRNAISAVGNYGELYARHLESIVPRERINTINEGNSGLIFSYPFGSLVSSGPGPNAGGTLKKIVDRGFLRCGITRSPGFGEFDATTNTWSGLDVDFCRAVSAAIFNGVSNNVDFRVLPATARFVALSTGDIDVLSRTTTWTLERDLLELTSGVGFSFSQPDFYDGVAVGGIPPYGQCADILDTSSSSCEDIKLCVIDGTTTIEVARARFSESVIVPKLTQDEVIAGLSNGDCNAIVGGVLQIVEPSVRDNGYTGPYETGQNRFSKDPLCMVTRQDDTQFTDFVNWIVTATFYAEEQGINQSTANEMPLVSLFGPLYGRMFIDAIQAVGNYGEIYARTVEGLVPRGGLNAANTNPKGPQHYPLPGI